MIAKKVKEIEALPVLLKTKPWLKVFFSGLGQKGTVVFFYQAQLTREGSKFDCQVSH